MFDRSLWSLLSALAVVLGGGLLVEVSLGAGGLAEPVAIAGRQEARDTVVRVCSSCHSTDLVFGERRSEADWTATLQEMRSLGAFFNDAEMTEIVAYLTANFGTDRPVASTGASTESGGAGSPSAAVSLPPGGEFVAETCQGCHTMERVFDARKSEESWTKTIQYMRTLGATVNEAAEARMVAYLTANFGPSSALPDAPAESSPLTGNDFVASTCQGCHTMERVFDAGKSEEGWTKTIQYMRTLGATVSDPDFAELVRYLTASFGPQ